MSELESPPVVNLERHNACVRSPRDKDPRETKLDWHAARQEYCDSVRSLLREALAGGPCDNMRLVCMALEHDRMHQETLSYMVTQQVTSRLIALSSTTPHMTAR